MHRIQTSINVRELNQRTSAVLRTVQEQSDIIPVRRGRDGEVIAYVVPAQMMFDQEAMAEARAQQESAPTIEEILEQRQDFGGRLAQTLEVMRGEERG